MAHNAPSHPSTKLEERRRDGAAEPEGWLILAHLTVPLIQLIKALIRLTPTPSGDDEWAAVDAELRTLYTVRVAVSGGGRWSVRQEGDTVVRDGGQGIVQQQAVLFLRQKHQGMKSQGLTKHRT